MSPRDESNPSRNEKKSLLGHYQHQAVQIPPDHFSDRTLTIANTSAGESQDDDHNHKAAKRNRWFVVGALGIAVLGLLAWHSGKSPDSTTLLAVDPEFWDPIDWELVQLNRSLTGRVWLGRHDAEEEFAAAARVWRQDLGLPRAIVEVATERDVQLAVPVLGRLARERGVPFRIRSGGHSKAGFSTVAGGITLSLRHLKTRSILLQGDTTMDDPVNANVLATIEPGSTVEDVLERFLQHAADSNNEELYGGALGQCGRVAEGGWVLGGGVGFMARLLGLGLDNARQFRIVLANGTAVTANDQENPDLFWALRGAGQGNYGVVTQITYQLHRVPDTQLYAQVHMPAQDSADFFYRLGESNANPEFFMVAAAANNSMFMFLSWFTLDPDIEQNRIVGQQHFDDNIRPLFPPSANFSDTLTSFRWAEDTHLMDPGYGTAVYAAQPWQGFLLPANNTKEVWTAIMGLISEGMRVAPDLQPHIELWGGAISDVDVDATAFPHRDAVYNVGVLLVVQEYDETAPQRFQRQVASVNSWWPQLAQYLTGSYLNYPMNSLRHDEYAPLYWGKHLERLVDLKQRYDPTNIFSFEQSVPLEL